MIRQTTKLGHEVHHHPLVAGLSAAELVRIDAYAKIRHEAASAEAVLSVIDFRVL